MALLHRKIKNGIAAFDMRNSRSKTVLTRARCLSVKPIYRTSGFGGRTKTPSSTAVSINSRGTKLSRSERN